MPTFTNSVAGKEHAIVGVAENGIGTHGTSKTSTGAGGVSDTGIGVHGVSTAGPAVRGDAEHGVGVYGASRTSDAIVGSSETGRAGYFVGNVEMTGKLVVAVDVILAGADCAEDFDATENAEPGSVMVMTSDGKLDIATVAYDRRVAGVVSGAGTYRPAVVLDRTSVSNNRLPIGLIGKVFCRVEADSAAIEVGDMLTSSDRPGHAMKAADRERSFGAILGKALGALDSGTGLVPMLICLQ